MRFAQLSINNEIHLAIQKAEGYIDLALLAQKEKVALPQSMLAYLQNQEKYQETLKKVAKEVSPNVTEAISYAPVVTNPEKILCVGLNYMSHRLETNRFEMPEYPVLFSKFNNALASHQAVIVPPAEVKNLDYEAELVLVIGKTIYQADLEEAKQAIFGLTIGNDFSARDLQFRTQQWLLGKSCDQFAPVGPVIVTSDAFDLDHLALEISCEVNGELRQQANTRDLIFQCAQVVSYASQTMTLRPGDLIFTGTPSGVILGQKEQEQKWLTTGDEVVVKIENIGELSNRIG